MMLRQVVAFANGLLKSVACASVASSALPPPAQPNQSVESHAASGPAAAVPSTSPVTGPLTWDEIATNDALRARLRDDPASVLRELGIDTLPFDLSKGLSDEDISRFLKKWTEDLSDLPQEAFEYSIADGDLPPAPEVVYGPPPSLVKSKPDIDPKVPQHSLSTPSAVVYGPPPGRGSRLPFDRR